MSIAKLRKAGSLFRASAAGMMSDGTFGMGAALAFYTIFSLGPVLVIATAVAAYVVGGEAIRGQLLDWAGRYFGPDGAKAVDTMIASARNVTSRRTATLVGIVTLFFGATGVFCQLKRSLNTILGAERKRRKVVRAFLLARLEALAAACAIGFVIFLGLLLSAGITAVAGFAGRWLPHAGRLFYMLNIVLSLVIVMPLFALILRFLPDVKVPWRSVLVGSGVTAVLFQPGALAMGAYLGAREITSVYGPAGSVLAVLIWAYYSAQTVLFGAEFTKAHAALEDRAAPPVGPEAKGSA